MPRDSNWNTAVGVGRLEKISYVAASSSGSVSSAKSRCSGSARDVAQRPVEDRQRGEAEEVELDQARPPRRRPCRTGLTIAGAPSAHVQRAEIGELAGRDQHAARVHADVARQAFELLGERQQLAHLLFVLRAARARLSSGSMTLSRASRERDVTVLPGWNGISFAMRSTKP